MSTLARKHVTHMFDGLCSISIPHIQHNTVGIVAVNMLDIADERVVEISPDFRLCCFDCTFGFRLSPAVVCFVYTNIAKVTYKSSQSKNKFQLCDFGASKQSFHDDDEEQQQLQELC